MSKKLYIAYGSNLNLGQMKYRCPTAKLSGTGVIENYELQFKGMPHCAYATIAPCEGKSVPVALWELQPRDEKLLDRYEGYPSHYFKEDLPVKINGEEFKTARHHLLKNLEGNIAWKDPMQAERQKERLALRQLQEQTQNTEEPEVDSVSEEQENTSGFVISM